jgi:hypothetical protein
MFDQQSFGAFDGHGHGRAEAAERGVKILQTGHVMGHA